MAPRRLLAAVLAAAALAAACGGSGGDEPQFVTVPLGCEAVLERLGQRAEGWPDPATIDDLQGVKDDLFSAVNALGEDCSPGDFERLEAIECNYLTTVTGADEAADAFLAAQQARCDAEADEADPDEPTATVEDDPTGGPAPDRCDAAREALIISGTVPDESNLPPGCDP